MLEVCASKLVDELLSGVDCALICVGGTAADQHAAVVDGGLLEQVTELLFERLRDRTHAGLHRTHEVRLGCDEPQERRLRIKTRNCAWL